MHKRKSHLAVVSPEGVPGQPAQAVDHAKVIDTVFRAMADAAVVGEQDLKDEVAKRFRALLDGHETIVIERIESGWRLAGGTSSALGTSVAQVPATIAMSGDVLCLPGIGTFIPVRPGVGILTARQIAEAHQVVLLHSLATGFDLALTAATQNRVTLAVLDEIDSLQQIAERILSATELDEVLFAITRETTQLLNADIGGVFLRDGDDLAMRSCVGNDTLNIDRLRMKRGQGLAGRVLETSRPCKVDDYLESDFLNRDFVWLARDEQIRCAVGAPLLTRDGVIGVLEVWRRRAVPFTEQDVQRIVALANLTTIAIQNARLYENQKSAVQQLTATNESLRRQNEFVQQSAQLQDDLIGTLLDGSGIEAIARVVARHAAVEVAVLGIDSSLMACYPSHVAGSAWLTWIGTACRKSPAHDNHTTAVTSWQDSWVSCRCMVAGGDRIGWVCTFSKNQPGDIQETAIRQAAVAGALYCLEQRAASQARTAALGALMWDLLEGTSANRQSALTRLNSFHIDLQGPLRVIHATMGGLTETARSEGWSMDIVERKKRSVCEACERTLGHVGALKLVAERGNLVVAITSAMDAGRTMSVLRTLHDEILAKEGVGTSWGVSAPCDSPSELPNANYEARCATLAVAKLGTPRNPIVIHEHLGVLALLLPSNGITDGRDLRKFVNRVLGPMLKYDSTHRGVLAKTVRGYLDNDCSLKLAASNLFVHEKTVRYRLGQFEDLTGVDLRRHKDRMSVDLALRMQEFAIRSETREASDMEGSANPNPA